MQTMAQQNRGGRHARQGGEANQYSNFNDFQDTKPPVFKEASEPLETEYLHAFNNLSHYATQFVDTEAKKLACFKRGLGPKLSKNMAGNKSTTFNEFVSDALTQENSNTIYAASKNHKRAYEAGASQSKAPATSKPANRPPNAVTRYTPPQKKSNVKTGVRKSFTVALP